jgi:hypothetical protein
MVEVSISAKKSLTILFFLAEVPHFRVCKINFSSINKRINEKSCLRNQFVNDDITLLSLPNVAPSCTDACQTISAQQASAIPTLRFSIICTDDRSFYGIFFWPFFS